MRAQTVDHMFNFTFEKPSAAIVEKAKIKRLALVSKIAERTQRLARVREEYKITDEVLVDIMQQARKAQFGAMQYTSNVRSKDGGMTDETITIGAGVVNNLLTERDFIDSEQAQVDKLDLIIRNLTDLADGHGVVRGHRLTFEELRYLGF